MKETKTKKKERTLSLTHNSPSKKISFKTVSKLKVVAHRKRNRWEQYLDEQSGYVVVFESKDSKNPNTKLFRALEHTQVLLLLQLRDW